MAVQFRSFVLIEVPIGSSAPEIEALQVGHLLDGPHDGMTRFAITLRGREDDIVIALGPVAATKLGAALAAASFDHNASGERWDSGH